jgi:hypothetical protein
MLSLVVLSIALALPLRAQIQNGDFTDGITHWHGDGRSPADFSSDNPLATPDTATSKGMIIPLKHSSWTKAEQDFDTGSGNGTLKVTYKISKDFKFSTKDDDYTNVAQHLGWGWKSFKIPVGDWMVFLTDSSAVKGAMFNIEPPTTPDDPKTMSIPLSGKLTPHNKTTLTLAFPPGEGQVIILGVSLEGQ